MTSDKRRISILGESVAPVIARAYTAKLQANVSSSAPEVAVRPPATVTGEITIVKRYNDDRKVTSGTKAAQRRLRQQQRSKGT